MAEFEQSISVSYIRGEEGDQRKNIAQQMDEYRQQRRLEPVMNLRRNMLDFGYGEKRIPE